MRFTQRGLIYKNRTSQCRSWEDLFQAESRDTPKKKRTFKDKYKDLIGIVKFKSERGDEQYLVASQELAGNKEISDLQRLLKGEHIPKVETNTEKTKRLAIQRDFDIIMKEIDTVLNVLFCGRYRVIDNMVVDLDTGAVIRDTRQLIISVVEFKRQGATNPEVEHSVLYLEIVPAITGCYPIPIRKYDKSDRMYITYVSYTKPIVKKGILQSDENTQPEKVLSTFQNVFPSNREFKNI